jgi:hypothetical protein
MIRATSLLFGLPVMAVALFAADLGGQLSFVETLLGIAAIVTFAVVAVGWTIDHDV